MPASLPSFRTRTLRAVLLGAPGIVALVVLVEPPEGVPAAALALNPALLLLLAGLAGAWAAPRVGLRSAIVLGGGLAAGRSIRFVALGLALGAAVAVADWALAPLWQAPGAQPDLLTSADPSSVLLGLLYGGLTEEVIMRWGLLGLLAVGLARLTARQAALRLAAILAAMLFAAAHLPALALREAEVVAALLARTLGFNLLLGLAFGWACLRGGLEAAIGALGASISASAARPSLRWLPVHDVLRRLLHRDATSSSSITSGIGRRAAGTISGPLPIRRRSCGIPRHPARSRSTGRSRSTSTGWFRYAAVHPAAVTSSSMSAWDIPAASQSRTVRLRRHHEQGRRGRGDLLVLPRDVVPHVEGPDHHRADRGERIRHPKFAPTSQAPDSADRSPAAPSAGQRSPMEW
jgi:hypothetical protein